MSNWQWQGKKAVYGMKLGSWLVRRTGSSRRGMAEDELIRITLFGERDSFKSVDSALLLPVSSKF